MVKLRDYQIEAIENIRKSFKTSNRQFIEMPTGSGKTLTFLSYADKYSNSTLIVVPSIQLMNQTYETALLFYHKDQISRKGDSFNQEIKSHKECYLHICVVNSLTDKYNDYLNEYVFNLIIFDEAHHTHGKKYINFIKSRGSPYCPGEDSYFLGVTATPDRKDGKMLTDILHRCSFKLTIEEMIEKKFLCDIEGFCLKTKIDIGDVRCNSGDFNINILYKKLCTDSRNMMIIDIYKKEMMKRKCIIFCINISHSKQIVKLFKLQNISSFHIDGTMNSIERKSILDSFRNDEASVLCNCQLLTEGFDEPSIDGIIIARPTRSRALFTQMIGRGLRIHAGKKNCKIIDIVDNHRNLAGFNSILEENNRFDSITSFKSIKEIKDYINSEKIKVTEFSLEKISLLNNIDIQHCKALDCMYEYLNKNGIFFMEPISFDEASFLIWHNELMKRYKNGNNC